MRGNGEERGGIKEKEKVMERSPPMQFTFLAMPLLSNLEVSYAAAFQ